MDDLYRTPTKNGGRSLDTDEVTLFQTPNKALVDKHRHNWRDQTSPSRGLPNSNRDNVVDALKNIQDRIRALEMERTNAEENLKDLSRETNFYRQSLEKIRQVSPRTPKSTTPRAGADNYSPEGVSPGRPSSRHQHDLQEQLRSADSRCELLDKQLEYMRKMLNEAEAEKRLAYERSEQMIRLRNANSGQEMRSQMDKISDMEREHHRLQASQAVAQERIRELERKLEHTKNEQENRLRVPNNLSSELRSAAKTNKILIENLSPPGSPSRNKTEQPVKQKRRKRTKKVVHAQPGQHYRLNLADIPFVVGQSTAPSHRVGSNVQNVIAMMKTHNRELCAAAGGERARPRSAPPQKSRRKPKLVVSATTTDQSEEDDTEIQDMMDQLTEEYTHMSAEHHELTREMDAATSRSMAADIQHEIEKLEIRMSTKAEQIAKLSSYQNKKRDRAQRKVQSSSRSNTTRSTQARKALPARNIPSSSTTGEVQVTTTIKTRGRRSDGITENRPPSRTENLTTLKHMKTLKTRLKPDDLHWST